jgi:ATP-binding cassette subfamily B multidrug efflux pump
LHKVLFKVKEKESKIGSILDFKTIKGLFAFAKPYIFKFYLLVLLTFLLAVLGPVRPYLIQYTLDKHVAVGNWTGLQQFTLLLIVLLIFQAIVEYSHTYISGWLGQSVIRDMRIRLYKHLLSFKLKYYDTTPIGRLVTRTISDIETLSDVFSEGFANIAGDILQIIFILIFMCITDWQLTLVSLAMIPFMFLATYVFKEKIKVSFAEVRTAVANLNTFVQEHITGMAIIQMFTAEKREYEKFTKINQEHTKAHIKSVWYYSVYFPVAEVISAAGVGLLVWYGAGGVIQSKITLGDLIAFIMYINMFFRPLRMIADRFNTLQMGIVSADRVLKLLEDTHEVMQEGDYSPQKVEGNISFENVSFAYVDENYVLKNISFEVKAGQTVALVGATGAGKTSVINLLNRFYEINSGTIKLDDIPIENYKLEVLRGNIGIVLQDVFLFCDTIYNNITLGNTSITKEQVIKATEMVGAMKFIEQLPQGFDYVVMERGATLSVGQRQLISFIRALVYNPTVLVLDEATSSVDTETEEVLQNAINLMMKDRTSIVIAHRLSTIKKANQILVFDKGEIKEKGTHDELIALNGFYAQLINTQKQSLN